MPLEEPVKNSSPTAGSWWLLLIPFAAAVWGGFDRSQYSFPFLYGTLIEAGFQQIMGAKPDENYGGGWVLYWALTALLGLAASLVVISVGGWKSSGIWRFLHLASLGTIPSILLTSGAYFFPPFALVNILGISVLPICTASAIICVAAIIRNGLMPDQEGLLTLCQLMIWSAVFLLFMDRINLWMVGGS